MAHQNLPQNSELIKKMESSPLSPAQWLILLLQTDQRLAVVEELVTALAEKRQPDYSRIPAEHKEYAARLWADVQGDLLAGSKQDVLSFNSYKPAFRR